MRIVDEPPYLSYSRYLRDRYGCSVYRIAVDAGFSCPHRKGDRKSPGCSFCEGDGARAPYLGRLPSVEDQVKRAMAFLRRRYRAEEFMLYFQAFSNTNAPVDELSRIYDQGLGLTRFRGLIVGTRPDCLDDEKTRLLASYRQKGLEVWVELGLQSALDRTLTRINRAHTRGDFLLAWRMLKKQGLSVAVHLILGLPGESFADMLETVLFVSQLPPDGVKIHNLHIPRGTPLEREFLTGEVTAPSPERHLEYVIAAIERLPPGAVIMRLTCDTPRERLASPSRFWPKAVFTARLAAEMRTRGARQGRLFTPAPPPWNE